MKNLIHVDEGRHEFFCLADKLFIIYDLTSISSKSPTAFTVTVWDLLTYVSPGTGPALVGGGVTWDTVHVGVARVIPAWIRVAAYLKSNL